MECVVDASAVIGKAAGVVVTGLTGVVAFEGVKKLATARAARSAAVAVTAWGMQGVRAAETGAERLRLAAADIASEARERIGEQTPPPDTPREGHDHNH
jgi:hypothetical protein